SGASARVDGDAPGSSREPCRSIASARIEPAGDRRGRRGAAMTLLAGLAVGVFVYFAVGFATGYTPEIRIRRFRRRTQISNRQLWLNQVGVAVTPRQFVAGSLAVGAVALAASGPPPLQEAFARFPMLARMLGTVPALEVIKEELADPTSDRVIEVLVIAHERGGQIVRDILEDLVAATTRDLKLLEEVET